MSMRIAYVSFEYPPDTALGGIATYVFQVAKMMKSRGHAVEVFCASAQRTIMEEVDGVLVHRIVCTERSEFPEKILPCFTERHQEAPFDLFESPEYYGDGYAIKRAFPSLPLVVKLHTPHSFIEEMTHFYVPFATKARFMAGGLMRGRISQPFWKWQKKETDIDYLITALADQVHTPSVSLGDIVSAKWDIRREDILDVPYPFIPDEQFLAIPPSSSGKVFTYVGRLEVRKGLVVLAKAVALVFDAMPDARFKIVGRTLESHIPGMTMRAYLERELAAYLDKIEFVQVTPDGIPAVLAETDVCVFPSIWENFPNVCLEAMSAARAVVGSERGGMKDMLTKPDTGVLIDPLDAVAISKAIVTLLKDPELSVRLGAMARKKILDTYNTRAIGELMEKHYTALLK
jgi:glycogen(starch) synthase